MILNYTYYHNKPVQIKKTGILIAGDSHPQKSVDPKYFNEAQNISQTAEPYVLTYWKLKKIVNTFIPDTLIIGFAPHNISEFNDVKFSDKRWSEALFRRMYPIQHLKEVSGKIPVDYNTFYKVLWKQTAFYPKKQHGNYIGKYANTKTTNISDCPAVVKRHFYNSNNKKSGVSKISVDYLDSIARLCNSKNIKLILVSNPVHQNYVNKIPSAIMKEFNNLLKKYDKDHIVFNLTTKTYPDSLYLNCDHLNKNGADKFTKELINYLQQFDERKVN